MKIVNYILIWNKLCPVHRTPAVSVAWCRKWMGRLFGSATVSENYFLFVVDAFEGERGPLPSLPSRFLFQSKRIRFCPFLFHQLPTLFIDRVGAVFVEIVFQFNDEKLIGLKVQIEDPPHHKISAKWCRILARASLPNIPSWFGVYSSKWLDIGKSISTSANIVGVRTE